MNKLLPLLLMCGLCIITTLCWGQPWTGTSWYTSFPTAVNCASGCTGTAASGSNINSGDVLCQNGTQTFSSLNLNAGTLRVCGTLTITGMSYNSGTIIITAGSTLNINMEVSMNGNCQILNYGRLDIRGNVRMQNDNNRVVNATTGSMLNILHSGGTAFANAGNWYRLELNSNTSYFVNYGTANINILDVQANTATAGSVMLGLNSQMILQDIRNKRHNSVVAPNGKACISYSNNAYLDADFSATNNVKVCRMNGALTTQTGGFGWNQAVVTTNCFSCTSVLPVQWGPVTATRKGKAVTVAWSTFQEIANKGFAVERQLPGAAWLQIGFVSGAGNSSTRQQYQFTDAAQPAAASYRLRQVDYEGRSAYSQNLNVAAMAANALAINVNGSRINIELPAGQSPQVSVQLIDARGRIVYEQKQQSPALNLPAQPSGLYILKIVDLASGNSQTNKLML